MMCFVTATELKKNLSFYIQKSATEDVYITKNGEVISCLTNSKMKALDELDEFLSNVDIKKENKSDDEILFEGLFRKHVKV